MILSVKQQVEDKDNFYKKILRKKELVLNDFYSAFRR